jgi:hypothetical protein
MTHENSRSLSWAFTLGMISVTVACGASDPELEPVDSIDENLWAGTLTTLRPEVGRFTRIDSRGRGWSCTATLLDARHALTAAHCVPRTPTARRRNRARSSCSRVPDDPPRARPAIAGGRGRCYLKDEAPNAQLNGEAGNS